MMANLIARFVNRLSHKPLRHLLNFWAPFRGAGIKVDHIASDFRSVDVSMKLRWSNRNYVGVHYGGSIFSMVDPFFMLILIRGLGKKYIVWDKAGRIEFKKPGKGTLKARCFFTNDEIQAVREKTDEQGKYIFDRAVDIVNEQNEVVATVVKTLYVKKK